MWSIGDRIILKSSDKFKLLALDNQKGTVVRILPKLKVQLDNGIKCWPRESTCLPLTEQM